MTTRWRALRERVLRERRLMRVASAGFATAVVVTATQWSGRPTASATAVVREAPFVETLTERGTVSAARMLSYGSTIPGAQAKILELAPEGAAVAAGEVLVRFDPGPFEEAVARAAAGLAEAEAEQLRAREDLRLERTRAETDVDAAKSQIGLAETALANERDGKGPLALAEAEAAAHDATRDVETAQKTADDMRALFKEAFVTRAEADHAEQALRQAVDRQHVADLRLKTLQKYDQPAAIERSRADVTAAEKGLGAATEAAQARVAARQAALALADSRVEEARLRLASARDQLARTTMRASTAGLVVYQDLFFGTDKRKPRAGDEVWPNQPLVAVPDPSQLIVETRIREIDLHKISINQHVTVAVDAYPGLAIAGSIETIGALAQEDPAHAGTRFFPVTIRLVDGDSRLRTGMTARVAIEVASLPAAVLVPIQALVEKDGVTRCFVVTRLGTESRVVEVGARNELVAVIRTGVAPGDTVVLDPVDTDRTGNKHP